MARQSRASAAAAAAAAAAARASPEPEQEEQQEEDEEQGEEQEDEPQQSGGLNSLRFNEPLSWKAGKAIPVATLIKRLTALSKELAELDQEDVDRDSLATPAKELAAPSLLGHKDDGVKAYAACCLADMLKLHAPDAPYTAQQLKDIFNLFVVCLKGLDDPDAPYYQQYVYLLDSLSTVKSVVLISELPDSEQITLALFTSFFDIAKPEGSKNVEYHMTDILVQLIDECDSLPTEVVDIIIAQFLRVVPPSAINKKSGKGPEPKVDDKQKKLINAVPPPAYNMAKAICNQCMDKMARHICQYFSEVILDAVPSGARRKRGGSDDDDEEDVVHEPSKEELHELNKAHLLAKELWKACPQVLQNVIPLLEQELLAENAELRELSCETIGEMALTGNFGSQAPATWKAWVGRVNDKSAGVRSKWVEAAVLILKERNDHMAVQLVDLIAIKLNDLDERVRLAACKALRGLDYTSITTKLAAEQSPFNTYDSSTSPQVVTGRKSKTDEDGTKNWGKRILTTLAERVRDKKIHVRLEGMRCLAKMWDMAYKDLASGNEVVYSQLGWIPSKILDTFYINDPEVNVLLDHVLHEILIPVNFPPIEKERFGGDFDKAANGKTRGKGKEKESGVEKEREREVLEGDKIRVQRLLVLVKGLDTKAKRALFAVPLRQISYAKVMEVFLKACEDYNGGVIEGDEEVVKTTLDKFSAWLSQKLPEPPRAKENLQKFAKLHDRRCYALIKYCFNPDSDYRTVVKALKEIKKRIRDSSSQGILDSLTPLLYRVSQLIYNKSHVAPIVEFSRTDELGLGATAHEVLKEMSASNPGVFKANVKALSDLLQDQVPGAAGADTVGAVDTLKACASFAKSYPKDMPQERKLLQALMKFALTGNPPAAAKHAVTILMHSANRKEMYAADLIKGCLKDWKFGGQDYLAKLACLGQLLLLAPDQCEDEVPKMIEIAREVLAVSRTPETMDDSAEEWAEENDIDDECKAKLLAMRILVNLLRHPETQTVQVHARDVMRLLLKTVVSEGEIAEGKNTPKVHKSRLRLAAAQFLLKLAQIGPYDEAITPKDFHRVATVAQDRCYQVRRGFIDKLKKYLVANKLPIRYYTIIFLMAYEPVIEWREETTNWIKGRTNYLSNKQGNIMENVFARLISLLVHHPDFGTQIEDLTDFARYILFYLTGVANEDNISLIYYVAQRVKQFRDFFSPDNSDNLYYLSELSQVVIRLYAAKQKWPLQTWPGKLNLPSTLFLPMQSPEESQKISKRTFLPDGVEATLAPLINPKGSMAASGNRKRKSTGGASASTTPRTQKPKTKRRKVTPPPSPPRGERRRSGRMTALKVTNYKESAPSDEEEDVEDDEDEDMLDLSDESGSEEGDTRGRGKRKSHGDTSMVVGKGKRSGGRQIEDPTDSSELSDVPSD